MAYSDVLTDVRIWVLMGLVAAFIVGDLGDAVPNALVVILVIQITASMLGIKFSVKDMKRDVKRILVCIFFCFVVNSGICVLCAYTFPSDDMGIFYGWIMVAAVPCAVSCVTCALTMYGNRILSVLSLAGIYIAALAITPVFTTAFIGDAISPLEIVKYIVLFVVVPLVITYPLNRFDIPTKPKALVINVMFFLLLMLSVGRNREYILDYIDVVALIAVFALVRTFIVGWALLWYFKKKGYDRGDSIDYMSLAVWKNTGLATSMCLVLLPTMPQAAVPATVCLLIESLWYAVSNNLVNKYWPPVLVDTDRTVKRNP